MTPRRRTSLPLGVLALTFFLPMADSCGDAVSPLRFLADERSFFKDLWLVPTFLTAAVLAVASCRSWRAKPIPAAARWATVSLVATLPVLAVLFAADSWPTAALYGGATVAAWLLLRRARRGGDAGRPTALLEVYVVAALPLVIQIFGLAKYFGAYLFLGAYAMLASECVAAAFARRVEAARGARIAAALPAPVRAQVYVEEELARFDEALDEYVSLRAAAR